MLFQHFANESCSYGISPSRFWSRALGLLPFVRGAAFVPVALTTESELELFSKAVPPGLR